MTTETTSELTTGEFVLNQPSCCKDGDGDDDNDGDVNHDNNDNDKDDVKVNGHKHHHSHDSKSQINNNNTTTTTTTTTPAITTKTTTTIEESQSRVKEQDNAKVTEEAVFINHGLVRWEKVRRGWLAPPPAAVASSSTPIATAATAAPVSTVSDSSPASSNTRTGSKQLKHNTSSSSTTSLSAAAAAIPLDVDEIIDLIFSQRWRSTDDERSLFPQPVPLPQMVDILVDLWEAEGLDI